MVIMARILFAGDVMPGGCFHYMDCPIDEDLSRFICDKHDFSVVTLEAAVGAGLPHDEVKVAGRNNIIYANNEDIGLLTRLNVQVAALANNHVCDLGKEGLLNTIAQCQMHGIKTCGAGSNIKEARKPAVITINGESYAFLSYCYCGNESMGYVRYATENGYGVAPLIMKDVESDIKECKLLYDYVVVMPHWGEEYNYLPSVDDVQLAKRMIEAGSDAVMGSHTHRIAPKIRYKKRPIYFSMGNFMFPDYYMKPPRPLFYPSDTERASIKREFGYPFPIHEPQMQIWEGMSRVGMVVSCKTDKWKDEYKLTSLRQDDMVGFFRKWSNPLKRLRVFVFSAFIKSAFYSNIYRWYYSKENKIRKCWHSFVGKTKIDFDERIKL